MGYLFPYAGSERRPDPPKIIKKPKPKKPPKIEKPKVDLRPIAVPPSRASMRRLMLEVCERHKVHPNDLVGKDRGKRFVHARREFVFRAKKELGAAFAYIGRCILKDHTTIIHTYNMVLTGASMDPYVPLNAPLTEETDA